MNDVAKPYVQLVLAVGQHDPAYVDAYYGPPEWQREVEAKKAALPEIRDEALDLLARVRAMATPGDELEAMRQRYFVKHLEALLTRVDMLQGKTFSFDDESRALYGVTVPLLGDDFFETILSELEARLPGPAGVSLLERVDAMRKPLVIPPDKLEAVFAAAIAECKARTEEHIELPQGESFTVELVRDKPWSGYNWYKGGYRSVIQINVDLPIYVNRAVELACHEGYPGHHVYNSLLEQRLVRARGWSELSIYPLYAPMSLIAEGSANYGVGLTLPRAERIAFEQRVIYPMAGLDAARAPAYLEVVELLHALDLARIVAAQKLLDGRIDAAAAAAFLVRYALLEPERATKYVRFIEANRSYVVNYGIGEQLVAEWIERQGEDRWPAFERLNSTPMLAGDLMGHAKGLGLTR